MPFKLFELSFENTAGLVSAAATIGDVETFSTAGSLTKHAPKIPVSRGSKSAGKVRCTKTKRREKGGGIKKKCLYYTSCYRIQSQVYEFTHRFLFKYLQAGSMLSVLQPFFLKVRGKSRFSYRFTRSSSHQILVLGLVGEKTIKSGYFHDFHEFESNVSCVRPPVGRAAALLSRCEMIVEGAGGDNK